MMRGVRALALACAAAWLPACLAEYTVGGAADSAGTCPEGQVVCGDGCALAGECDDDCPEGQVKCGEGCAPVDTCACEDDCGSELEACDDGVCRCRPGLSRCGGDCVDTRADPGHCDGCGSVCADEPLCQDAVCVAACDAPKQACDGACVDLASDSLHCGDCDRACEADEVCLFGDCRLYLPIDGCDSCPCAGACEADDDSSCCDSPFLGAAVCVEDGCS